MPDRPARALPIAFLLLGTLLVSACLSVKPASTRSRGRHFETFFIGEQGTQYFIKPLTFQKDGEELKVDFTFRYLDQMRDSATVHISLFRPVIVRQIDSLSIQSGPSHAVVHQPGLLFTERQGKWFHTRFQGSLALQDLHRLFMESGSLTVSPWIAGQGDAYLPTRKSGKAILSLRDQLFILF